MTQPRMIRCDGTNPDPVPNPPVAPKMITATASHILAILTRVRAIPIEGRADMTGVTKSAWQKDKDLVAKMLACKEHDKCYKRVDENPMLYLEERYHQIDPSEHQLGSIP